MRGIPEDKAVEIGEQIDSCKYLEGSVKEWLRDECRDLQEHWIPMDEFLKSDFQGLCWMLTIYNDVVTVKFFDDKFILVNTGVCVPFKFITHVMPIHKPEPPK